jgi:hypothetical protein
MASILGPILGLLGVGVAAAWAFWPKGGGVTGADDALDLGPDDLAQLGIPNPASLGFDLTAVLRAVGQEESGLNWGMLNPADRTAGVSFGFWQFNQAAGSLGSVFGRWYHWDPAGVAAIWGEHAAELIGALKSSDRHTRLSVDLSHAGPAFVASGQQRLCRVAQLSELWDSYLHPILGPCQAAGLGDSVGIGVALDRAVQQGTGTALSVLAERPPTWHQLAFLASERAAVGDRAYIMGRAARVAATLGAVA